MFDKEKELNHEPNDNEQVRFDTKKDDNQMIKSLLEEVPQSCLYKFIKISEIMIFLESPDNNFSFNYLKIFIIDNFVADGIFCGSSDCQEDISFFKNFDVIKKKTGANKPRLVDCAFNEENVTLIKLHKSEAAKIGLYDSFFEDLKFFYIFIFLKCILIKKEFNTILNKYNIIHSGHSHVKKILEVMVKSVDSLTFDELTISIIEKDDFIQLINYMFLYTFYEIHEQRFEENELEYLSAINTFINYIKQYDLTTKGLQLANYLYHSDYVDD